MYQLVTVYELLLVYILKLLGYVVCCYSDSVLQQSHTKVLRGIDWHVVSDIRPHPGWYSSTLH